MGIFMVLLMFVGHWFLSDLYENNKDQDKPDE